MLKILKNIVERFGPLQSKGEVPQLKATHDPNSATGILAQAFQAAGIGGGKTVSEGQHRINMEAIEVAKLSQELEINNNNLKAQHRALKATIFATFIALLSSLLALYLTIEKSSVPPPTINVSAPKVEFTPNINVTIPPNPNEAKSTQGQ